MYWTFAQNSIARMGPGQEYLRSKFAERIVRVPRPHGRHREGGVADQLQLCLLLGHDDGTALGVAIIAESYPLVEPRGERCHFSKEICLQVMTSSKTNCLLRSAQTRKSTALMVKRSNAIMLEFWTYSILHFY